MTDGRRRGKKEKGGTRIGRVGGEREIMVRTGEGKGNGKRGGRRKKGKG